MVGACLAPQTALKSLQKSPSAHPPFGILGRECAEGRDGAQSIFIPEMLSSGSAWMRGWGSETETVAPCGMLQGRPCC